MEPEATVRPVPKRIKSWTYARSKKMEWHNKKSYSKSRKENQGKEILQQRKAAVAAKASSSVFGKDLSQQIKENSTSSGYNEASGGGFIQREARRKRARIVSSNSEEDLIKLFFEAKEDERVTFAKFIKELRESVSEMVAENRRSSAASADARMVAATNQRNAALMEELLCRQTGVVQLSEMILHNINILLVQLNNKVAISHQQPSCPPHPPPFSPSSPSKKK